MRMETSLQARQEMRLKLAPQIIQSIEILQLSALDLQDLIQQELDENMALEVADGDAATAEAEPLDGESADRDGQAEEAKAEREDDERDSEADEDFREELERMADLADGYADYLKETGGRGLNQAATDRRHEALQNTVDRPDTLQETLLAQFELLDAPAAVEEAGRHIICNLDDAGYLVDDLAGVIRPLGGRIALEDAEAALEIVQGLEPRGVGARNLAECLLLQLDEEDDDYYLLRELIEDHLEDVQNNRVPKIARATGRTVEEINGAMEAFKRLNPRPGAVVGGSRTPYVTPDVTVHLVDGEYEVTLERQGIPTLYISPLYRRMIKQWKEGDEEALEFIREKVKKGQWLIDAIHQRQSTLQRISNEIVRIQRDFLDHGLSRLKPLKMQEVADQLGVHVSTVSRAISEKYVQTPRGIFPLKFFFTGGTEADDGHVESRLSVKQRINDLIDAEDKSDPLSDERVAEALKEEGLDVARRTVTKYRKQLGLPSSRKRKQY